MILAAASRVIMAATLMGLATEARADVLELGAEGARWVSGPLAGAPAAAPSQADANVQPVMFEGIALPESAVADPARHAAGAGVDAGPGAAPPCCWTTPTTLTDWPSC